MDTPGSNKDRKSKFQLKDIPLLLIGGFAFFVLVGITGCFDSETEEAPPSVNSTPVGANPQPSEGLTLWTDNCAMCHFDGVTGNTPAAINAAIANIGAMSSIALTADQIQLISDYLTGNTGGGSGGGTASFHRQHPTAA